MHDAAPTPAVSADTPAPKGLKIAGLTAAMLAIGVVGLGALARSHDVAAAANWSNANAIPTVHLVPVKGGAASDALDLPATLEAWEAARLFPRVSGYVRSWSQDIGAHVGAGQALGVVDTPELDEQIGQARAALASAIAHEKLARSTAARWNDLLTSSSVSKQEVDEKNGDLAVKAAGVAEARAALSRLEAMKRYAVIRAPFAGVVTARNAEVGDLVGPGAAAQSPMFGVDDTHRIRVYVSVPQSLSATIKPGMTASLTVPAFPGRQFTATVAGLSSAVDPQSGAFRVQLYADNPDGALKPGGYAEARFDLPGQAGAAQVPSSAILFGAGGAQVATVDPHGRIMMHKVHIGQDNGPTVQILSGIKPGAQIVDNPPDSLAQGELVRVGASNHG
ncbi:efflux transporter, RND family, MFP subunit [Sphingomonas sp. S17]|uniref:Efflux RND transporter periplasmic adaptor subunit n=3 Tax=Pseudomonadota TaxID=1224 RepID=A0A411LLJ3_SPHPI|nr:MULTISPECIES: efflux RND transporter periplasmic adaptor subunit [Sphingomonas]EGI55563.1 efflux transporter, RND family, MFP subunit [Sphingomonas sp. S17]MBQ1480685.1 efflux RND transporter periplasmic adaptor subunit [Sphingomonas sp.]MCM3680289.1 efflux RND transporter periplasmic adaptor subunit [Sphingomonas paucimobilis]MDG5970430.1 efflux RND transporter periplasmic adaptor subunit [Sphingomonas paucimobilis]NNG58665.1 efflux RND transporter periplasmic adaptor subunit [Sphingomonas